MRRGSVRMNTDDEQEYRPINTDCDNGLLKIHSTEEATSLLNEDEYVSNSAKDDVDVQITTKRSANIRNEEGIVFRALVKDGAEVYQCHSRLRIKAEDGRSTSTLCKCKIKAWESADVKRYLMFNHHTCTIGTSSKKAFLTDERKNEVENYVLMNSREKSVDKLVLGANEMLKVEDRSNPKLLVTREHITSMQHKLQVENIKHFGDVCTRSDLCRTTTDDTFFRLYSVGIGFGYIIWAFLGK
ncbi:Pex5l [Acrasis kona]|uniref:Pex5l n=1 Tax=Acrasis kona TaxID=1008807 RepID=A0AAW2ZFY9_9EUKA